MTRKSTLIFCDNEHGTGDVTFPDVDAMSNEDVKQLFIQNQPLGVLRKQAKAAGWGRLNGGDYCPACMEGMS